MIVVSILILRALLALTASAVSAARIVHAARKPIHLYGRNPRWGENGLDAPMCIVLDSKRLRAFSEGEIPVLFASHLALATCRDCLDTHEEMERISR